MYSAVTDRMLDSSVIANPLLETLRRCNDLDPHCLGTTLRLNVYHFSESAFVVFVLFVFSFGINFTIGVSTDRKHDSLMIQFYRICLLRPPYGMSLRTNNM